MKFLILIFSSFLFDSTNAESAFYNNGECFGHNFPYALEYGVDGEKKAHEIHMSYNDEFPELTLPPCGYINLKFGKTTKWVNVKVPKPFGDWYKQSVSVFETGGDLMLPYCLEKDSGNMQKKQVVLCAGKLKLKINFDISLGRKCEDERKTLR